MADDGTHPVQLHGSGHQGERPADEEVRALAHQQRAVAELGQRALANYDLQGLMQEAVEIVARVLAVEHSEILELAPGGEELLARAGVGWAKGLLGRPTLGAGLDSQAGYALLSEEPVIVENLRSERRFSSASLLREHGVVSSMTTVIRGRDRPFGVLGTHTGKRREFTDDDVNFLRAVANVLAAAIERKRGEKTLRFLAEAGAVLSSALDYRTILASVAHLAVPTLADWCAVDVLAEDGSIERVAEEPENPEKVALVRKLRKRYSPDLASPHGTRAVIRSGQSQFYPELTDEMLKDGVHDEEHLDILREIGITSMIIVPMVARGRTLGAITLVSTGSGRLFGGSDLELAEELARRAALAQDNARLYEEAQKEIAEREWAEQELRRSRDHLDVVLKGIADGITAQDTTGRVIYANDAAARLTGYHSAREFVEAPAQEVMRRVELLDEEGYPFPLERLPGQRALAGEERSEELLCFRVVETGQERWSMVKATPVFDEQGTVRMAVNIFRDVTERRRAEEARRRSEERYRRFVEQSTEGIWRFELERAVPTGCSEDEQIDLFYRHAYLAECNDAMARMYGFERAEEIVSARLGDLLPRSIPQNIEYLKAFIRSGYRMTDGESHEVDREGNPRYFLNNLTGIVEDGLLVRAWGTHRDVTKRKRAEEALRESEERFRLLAEEAVEGLLLMEKGKIVDANRSYTQMYGYTLEELIGMEVVELSPAALREEVWRRISTGNTEPYEARGLRKDGTTFPIEVRPRSIPYHGRELRVTSVLDLTERKRTEEVLREVREAERNRMSRDLHDGVLQDLSYAVQALQLIKLGTQHSPLRTQLQQQIDGLRRATQELRGAVYDLRLSQEQNRPFLELLTSLIEQNRRMVRERNLNLVVQEGVPASSLGEAGVELLRILQEALTNVRRHAQQATNVVVSVRVEGEDLVAEVSDDGGGFDPQTSPGVGLRSMRERAAAMGGTLEVESEPGRGTRVWLRYPFPRKDRDVAGRSPRDNKDHAD